MDTPVSISKQEAIDMFGGSVGALAAALGITRSAIYMWPDDAPIPELQAMRLRYELRPDAVPSKGARPHTRGTGAAGSYG